MSKGVEELFEIVRQLYPYQRIELEYNIVDRGALFLDIYLPRLKLAFEFDGVQHFIYNKHFHGSRENFIQAKRRDVEKDERCKEEGITLIRVAYNEQMSKDLILDKLEEALDG